MSNDFRALPLGHTLSDYRVDGILGQGGFGITYLAVDTMLNLRVAIKEYFPREFAVRDTTLTVHSAGNNEDKEFFRTGLQRFLEEARVLALFDHPNIVGVRRFFEANGTAYLVMDYCDGDPLDEFIKRNGPLNSAQLDKLLVPILDGLEKIHNANFLHRDIKPANIFIRSDGSPVLLDFGAARQEIASHSRSITSFATEGYASVEQYSTRGKQGPSTDIYGFAATLYRAITDVKPQGAPDRILHDTLEPCSVVASGKFDKNILHGIDAGMGIRPEDRPQSIKEWRKILHLPDSQKSRGFADAPQQTLAPKPINPTPDEFVLGSLEKRNSFKVWIIGFVVLIILIALIAYYLDHGKGGTTAAITPAPIPGVQGGASPTNKESWESSIEAIIKRQKAGSITESTVTTNTSSDLSQLKSTLGQYPSIPASDVVKMELTNIWYYTKAGKFHIRLLNPGLQNIDQVIVRFSTDCKTGGNVKYALLGLKTTLQPSKEILYSADLPMGGGFNLDGYSCAVVQDAYAPIQAVAQPQSSSPLQPQACVGTNSSSWTNCFGTQSFGSDSQWSGQKYVGTFLDGKRSGKGIYTWPNGDKYSGDFKNNAPNGQGLFTWADGSSYSGSFKDGLKSGNGTQKWPNGTKFIGEYKNDVREGRGILYAIDGSIISSGIWSGGTFKDSSSGQGNENLPNKSSVDVMASCVQAAGELNRTNAGKAVDNITKLRSASCYKKSSGEVVFVYTYDITSQDVFTQAHLTTSLRPDKVKKWCGDKVLRPLLDVFSIEDKYYSANGALMGTIKLSRADCK